MDGIRVYLGIVLAVYICRIVYGQDATTTNIAYVGSTVTIDCPLAGSFTYPTWRGPPDGTRYTIYSSINPAVSDRISWAANQRDLIMTNVTTADAGTYTCSIVIASLLINGYHTLVVRVLPNPPEISNTETIGGVLSVMGTEEQPLILTCVCWGGVPAPTLAWYRNTVTSAPVASTTPPESNATSVTVTYTFTPGRNEDKVAYICQSSFQDSQPEPINQTSVKLYLDLKPSTPTVKQNGIVTAGYVLTLQCETSGFRPTAINVSLLYKGTDYSGNQHTQIDSVDTYRATSTLQLNAHREDNGGIVECIVTHSTLPSPLQEDTALDIHFAPVSVAVVGNGETVADGATPLTLTCTVGDANPAVSSFSWTGPGVGTETSKSVVLRPTRDHDGFDVTCTATNTVGSTTSPGVKLDLQYSPIAIISGEHKTVIEGTPDVDLTCSASSKPAATFTWYQGNSRLGTGTGTETDSSWSYRIDEVRRSNSGKYRCDASNGILPEDRSSVMLTVQYPPDVTAIGQDSTVNYQSMTITCYPTGVPNTYTYYSWVHSWSDGQVISQPELPATRTLTLTNLTYQHSGVYTCRVSNGVANYGTVDLVSEGSTSFINIKSHPIIIDPEIVNNKVKKVATMLHRPTSVNITYYSNAGGATVSCHRVVNNSGLSPSVGVVTTYTAVIQIPMFGSAFTTSGTRTTIKLTIDDESELGFYQVNVHNTIGTTTIYLEIKLEGPPDPPEQPAVSGVLSTSVNVSWNLGFHGGLRQTCVVQYSTDDKAWTNGTALQTGLSETQDRRHVSVDSLLPGQLYYLRIYAYNEKGESSYTDSITVTTNNADAESAASTDIAPIVGGLAAALVIIAVVVVVVVLYKKGYLNKGPGTTSNKYRASVYENEDGTDGSKLRSGTTSDKYSASVYENEDGTDGNKPRNGDPQAGSETQDESISASYEMLEGRQGETRTYDELQLPEEPPTVYENTELP